jgi:hypothetical protein
MRTRTALSVSVFALLVAPAVAAQPSPAIIADFEYQRPKNGMVKQYEDGRKQKAAWHKQQNDSQPLYVWETLTGENTGTYIVGRLNQRWSTWTSRQCPTNLTLRSTKRSSAPTSSR